MCMPAPNSQGPLQQRPSQSTFFPQIIKKKATEKNCMMCISANKKYIIMFEKSNDGHSPEPEVSHPLPAYPLLI